MALDTPRELRTEGPPFGPQPGVWGVFRAPSCSFPNPLPDSPFSVASFLSSSRIKIGIMKSLVNHLVLSPFSLKCLNVSVAWQEAW